MAKEENETREQALIRSREMSKEELFTDYFYRYSGELYWYIHRQLGIDRETAKDLMEDVWVVFWEKMETIGWSSEQQIPAWLNKTAYYKVRNYRRKENYKREILYPQTKMEKLARIGRSWEYRVEEREKELLEEYLQKLRPVEQAVINVRRQGVSYQEMSIQFQKSSQALECIYSRAVKKLKRMLDG